jgi:hypothetical protein
VSAPAYLSRGTVRKPARLAIVAVLLLWAGPAMTEDGPKASAPLPPPLPAAPAEAPSPRMDVKPSGQPAPEKADPPEKELDKPKTGSPQVNSSAAPNVTRAARKKDNRSLKEHAGTQAAPPVSRSALIPDERRRTRHPPCTSPAGFRLRRTCTPFHGRRTPPRPTRSRRRCPLRTLRDIPGALRPSATATTIPIAGRRLILHPSDRATDFPRGMRSHSGGRRAS